MSVKRNYVSIQEKLDKIIKDNPYLSKVTGEDRRCILQMTKNLDEWIKLGFQPTAKEIFHYEKFVSYNSVKDLGISLDDFVKKRYYDLSYPNFEEIVTLDEYISPKNVYKMMIVKQFKNAELLEEMEKAHPFLNEIDDETQISYAELIILGYISFTDDDDVKILDYIMKNFEVNKRRVLLMLIFHDSFKRVKSLYGEGITLDTIEDEDYHHIDFYPFNKKILVFLYENTTSYGFSNFVKRTLKEFNKLVDDAVETYSNIVHMSCLLTIYLTKCIGEDETEKFADNEFN